MDGIVRIIGLVVPAGLSATRYRRFDAENLASL